MKNFGLYLAATSLAGLTMPFGVAHAQGSVSGTGAKAGTDAADDGDEAIVVIATGTRLSGVSAVNSAAPIAVIDQTALGHVGQPGLTQALTQIAPSFSAQNYGYDAANLTLSARLRGLSPNQTLVLINGKRRHATANLQVAAGPFQGAAAPDIDLIPAGAIDHVEILTDGAAAQYGSDAIAGVINIILKNDNHGFTAGATGGAYYRNGGDTFAQTATLGTKLGDRGFLNLTVQHRFHGYSQQGGADIRLVTPSGVAINPAWTSIPGFPNLNRSIGDARSFLTTGFFNAGYDFGRVQLYSFGSYSRRVGSSFQNYRLPSVLPQVHPNGFSPRIGLEEDDYAATIGAKGALGKGTWDISTTYGHDESRLSTLDSANLSLYADTGFTPTNFYDGAFRSSQWTTNLDVTQPLDFGLSEPAQLALGGEFRYETYAIAAGDAASAYKVGASAFPGFGPADANKHNRKAISAYANLNLKPTRDWLVDLAVRYEHYSDFGSTATVKGTTRYDFSPSFALRGTVSTGFRAPTLAEEYFSSTIVSPVSAIVQLPANSPSAKLIGFQDLRPEKSTGLSAGFVARPAPRLTVTADGYVTWIRSRIVSTGTVLGRAGTFILNQAALDAIAAHGNIIDPTVPYVGVSVFTNGANTRTEGFEIAANYTTNSGLGRIDWSLTGNVNKTRVTENLLGPALFNQGAVSNLEEASPAYKFVLGALLHRGNFTLNLREALYGEANVQISPDGTNFYREHVGPALITDLEAGYKLPGGIEIVLGASNLFDKRAPFVQNQPGTNAPVDGNVIANPPAQITPYGINGGYYYGRLTISL